MADYFFPVQGYPKGKIALHWGQAGAVGAADLFAVRGTPVRAMVNGACTQMSYEAQYGGWNLILKGDPDTKSLDYYYAHLDKQPLVQRGQRVTAGQKIGEVGDSGNAVGKGCHLHIGIGLGIRDGSGAWGGAGNPWPGNNCTQYLQYILDNIGSGSGDVPPPPPPINYEIPLRTLTSDTGGVLVSLRDRKAKALAIAAQATEEAMQIQNIINEVIKHRPK